MAVPVDTRSMFTYGKPIRLFQKMHVPNEAAGPAWDVSPDGKWFLMIKQPVSTDTAAAAAAPRRIHIVLNWTEELKQRAPVGKLGDGPQ